MIAAVSLLAVAVFWLLVKNETGTKISTSLIGFVNLPIFFVAYELAVEQTKSIGLGEALPCGVINMLANGISFVIVVILTPVLASQTQKSSIIVLSVIAVTQAFSLMMILIVKKPLK